MTAIEECPYCFHGEVGFGEQAIECPVCEGSGFARPLTPAPKYDTRKEEALDRDLDYEWLRGDR